MEYSRRVFVGLAMGVTVSLSGCVDDDEPTTVDVGPEPSEGGDPDGQDREPDMDGHERASPEGSVDITTTDPEDGEYSATVTLASLDADEARILAGGEEYTLTTEGDSVTLEGLTGSTTIQIELFQDGVRETLGIYEVAPEDDSPPDTE